MEGLEGSATARIRIGDRTSDRTLPSPCRRCGSPRLPADPVAGGGARGALLLRREAHRREPAVRERRPLDALRRRGARAAREVRRSRSGVRHGRGVAGRPVRRCLAPRRGWRRSRRSVRAPAKASANVKVNRLSGPFARLAEALFDASGTLRRTSSSTRLRFPARSSSRRAASPWTRCHSRDGRRGADDGRVPAVSGALGGYRQGVPRRSRRRRRVRSGPRRSAWGWERASLPAEFRPAAPIAVRGVRVSLAGGGALSLAGDFVVANGPRLTLDLAGDEKGTDVRNLTVADGDSLASMALRRQEAAFDVRFKGRFAAATVAKLFEERRAARRRDRGRLPGARPGGEPRPADGGGDAHGDRSRRSDARRADHDRAPRYACGTEPVRRGLVLPRPRRTAVLGSLGSATFGDEAIVLDMDVATGDLSWTRVEKVLGRLEDAKKKAAAAVTAVETKAVETSPKTAAPALSRDRR